MSLKRVFKYPMKHIIASPQTIRMQKGAQVLAAQAQQGGLCLWAMVDPAGEFVDRQFVIYGTGHEIDSHDAPRLRHIGTTQMMDGVLVWHIFEVLGVDDIPFLRE